MAGRARIALTAALAAAALAGCGEAKPTPDENAGASATTFLLACSEERGAAALETLTEPSRDPFIAAPDVLTACGRVLGLESAPDVETLRRAEVVESSARGGLARVVVALPTGERRELEAELSAGSWLLANAPLVR